MAGVFERSEFPAITDFAGQAAACIRLKATNLADSQGNGRRMAIRERSMVQKTSSL